MNINTQLKPPVLGQITTDPAEQSAAMERYYRWQSKIYDSTRWAFLFGRRKLFRQFPAGALIAQSVVEVGVGTGANLKSLQQTFPFAKLFGVDVSASMIERCEKKLMKHKRDVTLLHQPYDAEHSLAFLQPDVIVFSYALSMINPHWESLLNQAKADLRPGGYIAVVDFHDTAFSAFRNHMSNHRVRMEGHLLPALEERFKPITTRVNKAYRGGWRYLQFIGQKPK